ncbi:hypothetical protein HBH76_013600 [Parastagonospora nodorum]|nr:hypothetical protein HBH76_013600 [Parastagonospora nodorum]
MSERVPAKRTASDRADWDSKQRGDPEPDPEPPAVPPVIILSENGKVGTTAPQAQPYQATSPQKSPTASRYNLRIRTGSQPTARGKEPDSPDDPFPAAPPVIILSNKRHASSSPPRSPPPTPSNQLLPNSDPNSSTVNPLAKHIGQPPSSPNTAPASPTYHKHAMGSKSSKLAPSHGKLQPSQDKQDKAEMAEPTNYYSHRSKSMRRKAGKTGATSGAGGSGGGAGGGAGGAV